MRIRPGVASALDQAWLSLLNLAISFAFIRFASKEDYGIYLLLMTPLYLVMGLQNALILSPIATVLPAAPPENKAAVYSTAVTAVVVLVATGAVLGGAGLTVYWSWSHGAVNPLLPIGFGLAVAGVCAREATRTLFYTQGQAASALMADLLYGAGLIVAMGLLSYLGALTPGYALLATGIAALWPYVFRVAQLQRLHWDHDVAQQFWACGRWAMVGVMVTWVNLSAYPLIVGLTLSTTAVADINVARLFLMPVGLCIAAWSNLYRPRISAWASEQRATDIKRLTLRSIATGLAALMAFSGVIAALYPYLEKILGPSYRGLLPLVLLWCLFFALNLTRSFLMATLMTKAQGYKTLQRISWVALSVSLGGLWFLSSNGPLWVVSVLVAVELIQCLLIGQQALRWWRPSLNIA